MYLHGNHSNMNKMSILRDWSDLALFLAIAEAGTLAAAGQRLGLSQPSVGRKLAALEDKTGVSLFIRSGRRMVLSDTGRTIIDAVRRVERDVLAIEGMIEGQTKGLSGEVVISAAEGLGSEWLAPELVEFQRRHPDIMINVQIENRRVDLLHREADIALRMGRPDEDDLIAQRLANLHFGLYARRGLIENPDSIRAITDLRPYPRVEFSTGRSLISAQRQFAQMVASEPAFDRPPAYVTNSPAAHIAAVRAGLGVGVLSHRWASLYKDLVPVLPKLDLPAVELWIVTHQDLRHSARIRAVKDFIVERVDANRGYFEGGYTHGRTP